MACLLLVCAANLFFYAKWGLIYLILIPCAATSDFFIGRAIAGTQKRIARRLLLACSLAINIGLIISGRSGGLVLPLSLSFYAFQALTYPIDIYREDAAPSPSYIQYFASVSFFPTALAGPITRVSSLIPQWNWKGAALRSEEGSRALFLIGLGLAKKFLIADYLGNNLVNRVFDLPTLYSGGDVLVAVYAYAFQLYYDFSGYSDIAIGAGLLLGIRLPANFNAPYRAANIADFWRRWHISFSNWLRDYLYFSLPGPRTRFMPYVNLILTMALGGLWHGLSWTFLIWGLLHGIGLATFRIWQVATKNRASRRTIPVAGPLLTFHFVLLTWIFFRAANVNTALKILSQIATFRFSFDNTRPAFLIVLALGAAAHFIPKTWYEGTLANFTRTPALVQSAALTLLLVTIQRVAANGAAPFIYSRF
ncbi:MAG TPA: MBOAT family O-acyltransferase [Bryobacteraceae bacterium]|nr:MBOAT family O-acyltransferase [Bryobacteraceae bacterium]